MMTRRSALVGLAWLVTAAGAVVLVTTSLAMPTPATTLGSPWLIAFTALGADALVFASVGAVLAIRRPSNVVGLVLLASGPLIVLTFCGFLFGARLTEVHGPDEPLARLASLVGSLTVYPTVIIVGPVLALLFPDGRLPGRRWRWPVAAIGVALVVGTIMAILRPGPLNVGLANSPLGVRGTAWVDPVSTFGSTLAAITLPAALLLAVAAIVVRLRRADRVEREQLKWFLAANAASVTLLLVGISDPTTLTWFDIVGIASLSLPPIAVGIAILRYRLYEIDRIVSRTIAYACVSAVLFAVFAGVTLGMQAALGSVVGGDTITVAVSTLAVAALFNPLRVRLQGVADRRFNRSRYDHERVLAVFASGLRDEIDVDRLNELVRVAVARSVEPGALAVWLRSGAKVGR